MDCSLPGSLVHGIFQARVLEWVAISFSRGSSQPRDWTRISPIVGRGFTIWATREALLWMAAKKKRLTHSLPEVGHSRRDLQDNGLFTLLPQLFPSIQTQTRWLFWDISLPSSQSACFPNKVVFLALISHLWFYCPVVADQAWTQ